MTDDIIIEKIEKNPSDEHSERMYYRSIHVGRGGVGWKEKLKLAAFIIGGIAIGTVLFLFFLGLFFYFFIPIVIVLGFWSFFNRRR